VFISSLRTIECSDFDLFEKMENNPAMDVASNLTPIQKRRFSVLSHSVRI
jgi:hypothetical protein